VGQAPRAGLVAPDAEIDLHGLGLNAAHDRLMASLAQTRAMGARVILVIAGKPRPHEAHDQRGNRRGAIRAKLLDWLAASRTLRRSPRSAPRTSATAAPARFTSSSGELHAARPY
jgi:DNA-nicking Smr family endonuclease